MPEYNENPLVSLIVPVYNVEPYLRQCVGSIINQTYQNLEIILIDDGSTDNSGQICDEFAENDERIVVIHQENGGLSCARNAGISAARGSYLQFVDSDDYLLGDTVNQCVTHALSNGCDLLFFEINKHTGETWHKFKRTYDSEPGPDMFMTLVNNGDYYTAAWSFLIERGLVVREHLRFVEGQIYEDAVFLLHAILSARKVSILDEVLYVYRIRDDSIMGKKVVSRNVASMTQILEHISTIINNCENEQLRKALSTYRHVLTRGYIHLIENRENDEKTAEAISVFYNWVIDANYYFDKTIIHKNYSSVIWYGAGERCTWLLDHSCIPDVLWDINADNICEVNGIPCKYPVYGDLAAGALIIVCVDNIQIFELVKRKCAEAGFEDVCYWFGWYSNKKLTHTDNV